MATQAPLGAKNPKIATLRRLVRRRSARVECARYVIEGPTLVLDALSSGALLEEIYLGVDADDDAIEQVRTAASLRRCPVIDVAPGVLERVSDTVTARPVLAVASLPATGAGEVLDAADPEHPVLVLAGVADPGNAGTLLRSAEASGAAGVIVTEGSVDVFAPKVVRAGAGALVRLPVATGVAPETLQALRSSGLWLVGCAAGERAYDDHEALALPGGHRALALVLGSEAHGIDDDVSALLDTSVGIPIAAATESLNVAVAGSVLLFELARLRRRTLG